MNRIFLIALNIITLNVNIFAQNDSLHIGNKIINDVELSFNNNLNYFTKPLKFNGSDWLKFAGVIAVTGGLMTVDKEVNQEVIKNNNNFQDGFTKIGKYYGEGYAMAGIPLIVYGSGLIFNSKSFRTTGRLLIESLAAAGLTTSLLKILIGRSRPYANDGEYKFNFFETKNIKNSLPSGHSTVAFTISTVLSERIDNIYASIGLYSLATLTAYQRVYSNNHWLSDTFLGAAIGITAGKFFSDLEEERNSRNRISFQIMPTLNSENIGFNLVLHF